MRHALAVLLSSLLLGSLGACAGDEPCTGDDCNGPFIGHDPTGGPTSVPDQLCRAACSSLLRDCGSVSPTDSPGHDNDDQCTRWCQNGGLTADEASCVATTECADVGDCLEG